MVMKGLSVDLSDRGIIAVMIHPGWVLTRIGGPNATLTPKESVSRIRRVLASLTLGDSGKFLTYEGLELHW